MDKHVETGTILVDTKAMSKLLAVDRVQLWKHRAGVLWREVVKPVVPAVGIGLIWTITSCLFYVYGAIAHRWIDVFVSGVVGILSTVAVIFLFTLLSDFITDWLLPTVRTKIANVRSQWNPDSGVLRNRLRKYGDYP